MKRIIFTPAGRKRYLEILVKHLAKQKNSFDKWVLGLNTVNKDDIDYCKGLAKAYSWIETRDLEVPFNQNFSIHTFFREFTDIGTLYLRLDDDVIWMDTNAIELMFKERDQNKSHFLLFGNIINNAMCNHLHQRFCQIPFTQQTICGYVCMDDIGWKRGDIAEMIHRQFLHNVRKGNIENYKFSYWDLYSYERCSINVIAWRGDEFALFNGQVGQDEEDWLACEKPRIMRKSNLIFGKALFSHFAFGIQRDHLDKTDILKQYDELI